MAGEYNKTPYLLRQSGGGLQYDFTQEIDKLIGGTVAWNQLIRPYSNSSAWASDSGVTVSYDDGVATVSSTVTNVGIYTRAKVVSGHKYLSYGLVNSPTAYNNVFIGTSATGYYSINISSSDVNKWLPIYGFGSSSTDGNPKFYWFINSGSAFSNVKFREPMLIDLTQAFGAEIADYVYNLEQTTAGSGIAWLKSHGFLTKDYYAYNEGSLLSVKTSEHRTTGFNQWDEEWEVGGLNSNTGANSDVVTDRIRTKNYIPTVSNETYYCSIGAFTRFCCYDENKQYLGTATFSETTTPSTDGSGYGYLVYPKENTHYIRAQFSPSYGTTYNHDICINISDPSKNGTYEPYEIHSYPLDSDLELRGLFKLDANNNLYADGDVYESSGAVTRKYGVRAYQSGDESLADAITDGTNTVYKLTTPTTEQADPYASPQVVNPLGTEEYIDTRDVPVPVGHETFYPLEVGYGYTFISDLPSFGSGAIPSDLYLAVDDGENTMKISAIGLVTRIVNSMN